MIIGIISGYFNPIHAGHIDYIEGAGRLCDRLHVIVNNDRQVDLKGSTRFMSEESRVKIIGALRAVDRVVLSVDDDPTVVDSIRKIYEDNRNDPFIFGFTFMNGGDRKGENTPEAVFCEKNGIYLKYNVGGGKTESSSTLLEGVKGT
tara:strand:- start:191 stop:631 length:441 start_codon:yes stop_codon:yes gene_type:complete